MPTPSYIRRAQYFGIDPYKGQQIRDILMDRALKGRIEAAEHLGIPPDDPLVTMANTARDIYGRAADNPVVADLRLREISPTPKMTDPDRRAGLTPHGIWDTISRYYTPPLPPSRALPEDTTWLSDAHNQMRDMYMAQARTHAPKTRGVTGMNDLYTAYHAFDRLSDALNDDEPGEVSRLRDEFFADTSGMKYPEPPVEPTFWNTMYDALYGNTAGSVRQAPWLPNEEVFPYTSY